MRVISSGPARDDASLAQQQHVGEPRRDLLDVVGDQHQGRRLHVPGEHAEPATRSSRPPRSRPGGGLVEQHQLGVGHQRPGDLDPLALALAERAERAVGQVLAPERGEQAHRRGRGRASSYCSRQRPTTPYDAVTTTSRDASRRPGAARRSPALASPIRGSQLEHVDRAEHLAEDAGDAAWWGASVPAASCSRVVLPAPFGPRMTQRSPSSTSQVMSSSSVLPAADHADAGEFEDVAHGH